MAKYVCCGLIFGDSEKLRPLFAALSTVCHCHQLCAALYISLHHLQTGCEARSASSITGSGCEAVFSGQFIAKSCTYLFLVAGLMQEAVRIAWCLTKPSEIV